MFCTACGAPLAPNARFCTACGSPDAPAAPQPSPRARHDGTRAAGPLGTRRATDARRWRERRCAPLLPAGGRGATRHAAPLHPRNRGLPPCRRALRRLRREDAQLLLLRRQRRPGL
ncbi:zinc ribbon domain-containing protein [Enorma burkinafasonensis]|uniref:zinc-ribbon domain-containing protein n=1 Tax=Enorma burkinafasonensis TaxID=2590867 RepID=UPI0011A584D0